MNTFKLPLVCVVFALAGCNSVPEGCTTYVTPGGDDQTALQEAFVTAAAGDTLCLGAGTFTLTDPLEVSNLTGFTLRGDGMATTILDFSGQEAGGSGVDMMNMTNVLVEDLAIMDAAGNGIRISSSEGVVIRRVRAGWTAQGSTENGKYAIYPVSSTNVLVEDSEATNSSDAGFYMGQVTNCIMRNNVARGNVAAYEVENSNNCEVYGNLAEDNTGGILVFELPGLPMMGSGTLVRDNTVMNNNRDNFGDPEAIIGLLPAGTGIFALGANDLEIRGNTVTGHDGVAIAVLSYNTALAVRGESDSGDPSYDPYTDDVWVHDNTVSGNGGMPGRETPSGAPDALLLLLSLMRVQGTELTTLEELLWDGYLADGADETKVCFQNNGAATFRNLDVPGLVSEMLMTTTDITPHDCTKTPRPAVSASFADFAAPPD